MFYHPDRDIRVVVHGDDMTCLGDEDNLKWLSSELSKKYELKMRGILGPDSHDTKSIRILNRIVTWSETGITYEPDQRHVEIMIRALGLERAKSVVTPGIKEQTESEQNSRN